MTFVEWLAERFENRPWVVARRTKRIVEKYGDGVVSLSQEGYSELKQRYYRGPRAKHVHVCRDCEEVWSSAASES